MRARGSLAYSLLFGDVASPSDLRNSLRCALAGDLQFAAGRPVLSEDRRYNESLSQMDPLPAHGGETFAGDPLQPKRPITTLPAAVAPEGA